MKVKKYFVKLMLYFFGAKMFSKVLLQCKQSKVYGLFCENVYGRNLCQLNMIDEEQLQKFIELANLKPTHTVLDLGCGNGVISEYVSDLTGALIIGVDFAKDAIKAARNRTESKRDRIDFRTNNLNSISITESNFDCIISMDTLYFVSDLNNTIQKIKTLLKPDGQLLIFYSYKRKPEDTDLDILPVKNDLGKALTIGGFEFQTWNFEKNERAIWEKSLIAAEDLKEKFKAEGSVDIYKGRVSEAQQNIKWQNEGIMSRYLYRATMKSNT